MRTLRLGRKFNLVLVHDAIDYITTVADLKATIETAAVHLVPGGVALFIPDDITETFTPGTTSGGEDDADGNSVRYLEWTHDIDRGATVGYVDYVIMIKEAGKELRIEHDRHMVGLFPRRFWEDAIATAGLDLVTVDQSKLEAESGVIFVAKAHSTS